jgi:hypothetical protein
MDKRYVIDRVKSDLRNEIYDLMNHVGYHELEKELTESLMNANPLYNSLRAYSLDPGIAAEEKDDRKQMFAYVIYREMNSRLGGFHFDRFRSLSTGDVQDRLFNEIIDGLVFTDFLRHIDRCESYRFESEYEDFVASRQYRNLEDAITLAIKKGRVIPAVATAIAQDIVDALHLDEDYEYLRVSLQEGEKVFEFPPDEVSTYESIKRLPVVVDGKRHAVVIKRQSRTSDDFVYLRTNFGALIKGR